MESQMGMLPTRIGKMGALFGLIALFLYPLGANPQTTDSVKPKTPQQIEHSKIFEHGDSKLTDAAGDSTASWDSDIPAYGLSRKDVFAMWVCESDAVVQGKVASQTSFLTRDEGSVFTDAQISITKVFKDNAKLPLKVGQEITATRAGGAVRQGNRRLKVTFTSLPDFAVGREYLLFLHFLPSSQDYRATWMMFELRGGLIYAARNNVVWARPTGRQDAAEALADLASAVRAGGRG